MRQGIQGLGAALDCGDKGFSRVLRLSWSPRPSCPAEPSPKVSRHPPSVTTAVWCAPQATLVGLPHWLAFVRKSSTLEGFETLAPVTGRPSLPSFGQPKVTISPTMLNTAVWTLPQDTCAAGPNAASASILTGVECRMLLGWPNCPLPPAPKVYTSPIVVTQAVYLKPHATFCTGSRARCSTARGWCPSKRSP